jgi:hypothetical protein
MEMQLPPYRESESLALEAIKFFICVMFKD